MIAADMQAPAASSERAFSLEGGNPLPAPFAPLVRDAWYVIAERAEVGRELVGVEVLGEPLVYYRSENGEPVVLDDRCAHRRFPLSKSHLVGDTIRCGYHGFTFDKGGQCVFTPGMTGKPKFGVRKYPSVERGPWLWVWTGDEEFADPAQIPWPEDHSFEHKVSGYTYNPCNYMLLIENLLDLTHLHYLHGAHVVDAAYANSLPEGLDMPFPGTGWRKVVEQTEHGVAAIWCGEDAERLVRREEEIRTVGPSLTYADQVYEAEDGALLRPARTRIAHAITPKNLLETHQFWVFEVDTPLAIPAASVADAFHNHIFVQDVEAVGFQQHAILNDKRTGVVERGIATDRFAARMRANLRALASA